MDSTHPTRIGLALNYSVFNYEILGQNASAIAIAQKAFDDGIANMENLTDEQAYKESAMILKIISSIFLCGTRKETNINSQNIFL